MRRQRREDRIWGGMAIFIIWTALATLIFLGSACLFETATHLCDGIRCNQDQVCLLNEGEGARCVDIGDCGDGNPDMDKGEECDDGNQEEKDYCTRDCKGPVCGDGVVAGDEECDDGNNLACGTCDADCHRVTKGQAQVVLETDFINLGDGGTLVLNDGYNNSSILKFVYMIRPGDSTQSAGAHRLIETGVPDMSGSLTEQMIQEMVEGINKVNGITNRPDIGDVLLIRASRIDMTIKLENVEYTGLGNQPVVSSLSGDPTGERVDMKGGRTADCPLGVGCMFDDDCVSGFCMNNVCTARSCERALDCRSNDCSSEKVCIGG